MQIAVHIKRALIGRVVLDASRCVVFLAFAMCSIAAFAAVPAVSRPFTLPIAAKATNHSKDGKGWAESGIVTVPFVQAEASFKSAMAQSGWRYLHAVALAKGNQHTLYTWRRGGNELTLMLRRIDVNRTAFSWGLAKTGRKD